MAAWPRTEEPPIAQSLGLTLGVRLRSGWHASVRSLAYARPARVNPGLRGTGAVVGAVVSPAPRRPWPCDCSPSRGRFRSTSWLACSSARSLRPSAWCRGLTKRAASSTVASWFATTPGFGRAAAVPRRPVPAFTTRSPTSPSCPPPRRQRGSAAPGRSGPAGALALRAHRLPPPRSQRPPPRRGLRDRRRAPRDRGRALAQTRPRDPPHRRRALKPLRRGALLLRPLPLQPAEAASSRGPLAEADGAQGAGGRAMLRGRRQPVPCPPPPEGVVLGRRLAGERALPLSGPNLALALRADAPPRGDPRRLRHRQDRDLDADRPRAGHQEPMPRSSTSTRRAIASAAERFCALMRSAGRRVRVFPNEPFDAWRGDWRGIANRLLEVIEFAPEGPAAYYRDIAKTALQLACNHPDGPPRSSAELLDAARLRAAAKRPRAELARCSRFAARQGQSGAAALPGLLRPARRRARRRVVLRGRRRRLPPARLGRPGRGRRRRRFAALRRLRPLLRHAQAARAASACSSSTSSRRSPPLQRRRDQGRAGARLQRRDRAGRRRRPRGWVRAPSATASSARSRR